MCPRMHVDPQSAKDTTSDYNATDDTAASDAATVCLLVLCALCASRLCVVCVCVLCMDAQVFVCALAPPPAKSTL
jgi:hypothetical protein